MQMIKLLYSIIFVADLGGVSSGLYNPLQHNYYFKMRVLDILGRHSPQWALLINPEIRHDWNVRHPAIYSYG